MHEHHKHHIHLLIVTYVLLAAASPLVWGGAGEAHAQTGSMVCPQGYVCKPVAPAAVSCPPGYVCTPVGQQQNTTAGFVSSPAGFAPSIGTGFATYANSFTTANAQNAYTPPTSTVWSTSGTGQAWAAKPAPAAVPSPVSQPSSSTLTPTCVGVAYTNAQSSSPTAVWGAGAIGGTAPYSYTWTVYNDASNSSYASTHSQYIMAIYPTGGSKQAMVAVMDSTGASATASCYVTLPPASASPSPSAPSTKPNQK